MHIRNRFFEIPTNNNNGEGQLTGNFSIDKEFEWRWYLGGLPSLFNPGTTDPNTRKKGTETTSGDLFMDFFTNLKTSTDRKDIELKIGNTVIESGQRITSNSVKTAAATSGVQSLITRRTDNLPPNVETTTFNVGLDKWITTTFIPTNVSSIEEINNNTTEDRSTSLGVRGDIDLFVAVGEPITGSPIITSDDTQEVSGFQDLTFADYDSADSGRTVFGIVKKVSVDTAIKEIDLNYINIELEKVGLSNLISSLKRNPNRDKQYGDFLAVTGLPFADAISGELKFLADSAIHPTITDIDESIIYTYEFEVIYKFIDDNGDVVIKRFPIDIGSVSSETFNFKLSIIDSAVVGIQTIQQNPFYPTMRFSYQAETITEVVGKKIQGVSCRILENPTLGVFTYMLSIPDPLDPTIWKPDKRVISVVDFVNETVSENINEDVLNLAAIGEG